VPREHTLQKEILKEQEEIEITLPGADDDIMLTDIDRRLMNVKGDDEELEVEMQSIYKSYNLNRDIKVDHENFGIKSYTDNMKKELIKRE